MDINGSIHQLVIIECTLTAPLPAVKPRRDRLKVELLKNTWRILEAVQSEKALVEAVEGKRENFQQSVCNSYRSPAVSGLN